MSEEMKVSNKFNKKTIIIAAAAIVSVLALVLAITVPKQVRAQQLAEQLDLGDKYVSELDYEQAIAAYLKAIEIDPKCEEAYLALADIYIAIGEPEKAEEILRRAEKALKGTTEKTEEKKQEVQEAKKQKEAEATPKPTPTDTPASTPEVTPTDVPTPKPTSSSTPEPSLTLEATPVPTNTPMPEAIPAPTDKPMPTLTNTPTPTNTMDITPTPVVVRNETPAERFEYEENEEGGITITGFNDDSATSVVIPETIEGKKVTAINWGWYGNCDNLQSIELSSGISKVGYMTFWRCPALKEIKVVPENSAYKSVNGVLYTKDGKTLTALPAEYPSEYYSVLSGTERISGFAFDGCRSLKSVHIPSSIIEIWSSFADCYALEEIVVDVENAIYKSEDGVLYTKDGKKLITFPKRHPAQHYDVKVGTELIGSAAFAYCDNLRSIVLPSSIVEIESVAFSSCRALESIEMSSGISKIGRGAFYRCTSLKDIELPKTIREIGVLAFYNCSSLERIVIPEGVEALYGVSEDGISYPRPEFGCFENCKNLKEVILPNTLRVLGKYSFYGCSELTKINLPEGLEEIGVGAFGYCVKLSEVKLPATLSNLGESGELNYAYGDGVFKGCVSLKEIAVPQSVCCIAENAFLGCVNLERVELSEGVKEIGTRAFADCASLEYIEFPESMEKIGIQAFDNCTSLKKLYIPKNITYVEYSLPIMDRGGADAWSVNSNSKRFRGCSSMEEVIVDEANEYYASEDGTLFNKEKTILLGVPEGYKEEIYVVPDGVLVITGDAFLGCTNIKTIIIPDSVSVLTGDRYNDGAFEGCPQLSEVIFEGNNSIYYVEDGVVYENIINRWNEKIGVGLLKVIDIGKEELYIDSMVTSISYNAFDNCKNLQRIDVSLENELYTSRDGVLYNKEVTRLIHLPKGYEYAVYELPKGLEYIDERDFLGCRNIEKIEANPENEKFSSRDGVLYDKEMTYLCVIPEGYKGTVYELPERVCAAYAMGIGECENITTLVLPDSGDFSDTLAFLKLKNLKEIYALGDCYIRDMDEEDFYSYKQKWLNITLVVSAGSELEEWAKTHGIATRNP